MYLAVDVGGTKTLLAVFDKDGAITTQYKFPTPQDYEEFKVELKKAVETQLAGSRPEHACIAIPGRFSPDKKFALGYGNLTWQTPTPIVDDLTSVLGFPFITENDAKLAGLSEAILVQQKYKKVQFFTISTGIGGAIIINGVLDPNLITAEQGHMKFSTQAGLTDWEDISSGKALVAKYGQRASELEDTSAWEEFSKMLALGIHNACANIQPDCVILGGGVGAHFKKYGHFVNEELRKLENGLVPYVPVIGAQRAEEAVIYGCYELIKQKLA